MQRNLARAPSRQHPDESQQIKEAVYEWLEQDPRTRPTQEELASRLRDLLGRDKLSKQYINHLVNTLPPRHSEPPLARRHVAFIRELPESQPEASAPHVPSPPKTALSVEAFREKYYADRPWLKRLGQ